jgi:hypothetical protein
MLVRRRNRGSGLTGVSGQRPQIPHPMPNGRALQLVALQLLFVGVHLELQEEDDNTERSVRSTVVLATNNQRGFHDPPVSGGPTQACNLSRYTADAADQAAPDADSPSSRRSC